MGHGEDHCEYVGADSVSSVNVDKSFGYPGPIDVYMRHNWGDTPSVGRLSPINMVPSWYLS
ncbi:hypothetical protein KUTeg_023856 [Tegillarca granosa]|uniref:Target of Nesh-SH3/FNDC1 C-terminal domain-containing protein n=1 Tax=Tegillarca granosa TaxID=220873 RepID=A0ABQ9E2W9_TEGGR|nr:hypothetical protein KUTeg_023856 [Tegillarca granosa]